MIILPYQLFQMLVCALLLLSIHQYFPILCTPVRRLEKHVTAQTHNAWYEFILTTERERERERELRIHRDLPRDRKRVVE